jgi:hypothetical protein
MITHIVWSLAVMLAAASAVAAPPPEPALGPPLPSVTLPPELDRVLRDYEKAWQARDAAGLAALFAEDNSNRRPSAQPTAATPAATPRPR